MAALASLHALYLSNHKQIFNATGLKPQLAGESQLALCKHCKGFHLGTAKKQIQLEVRAVLNPGTTGIENLMHWPLGHAALP